PLDYDPAATQCTTAKQVPLPKSSRDFTMPLPKATWSLRARGNFTPGFRAAALRLTLLTTALVVTAAGAAWYKHWIPWKTAAKKPSVSVAANAVNAKTSTHPGSPEAAEAQPEPSSTKVASDAPVTSPGTPPQSAGPPETPAPEAAGAAGSAVQASASNESVAQPAVRRIRPS